jgi:lipid-binding SYLF domain-containing protein
MKGKSLVSLAATGIIAMVTALIGTVALALDTARMDSEVRGTLQEFYKLVPDQNQYLVKNAAAVLVFPDITKAGVGFGGEHGDGALLQNEKTLGYYSISGGSIGLTLGVSHHSQVILFQTAEARDKFVNGSDWSVGADASVAIVKKGAGGTYDSETLKKPVLVFVFGETGLMGDVSLQGTKISKIKP